MMLGLKSLTSRYIPSQGDIIWIQFNPQLGHEQKGHRPAIVLSPKRYNELTSLCILIPMTTKIKGYPFEVKIDDTSVALTDHVKSLDWKVRDAKYKGKLNKNILQECLDKILFLLNPN